MAFARLYVTIVAEDSGGNLHEVVASLGDPIGGPAVTGSVYRTRVVVAAGAIATLFTTDNLADFNLMVVTSTTSNVFAEITTDVNGGVGTELATVELSSKVPYILASNRSYANYTANFAGGSVDAIERVRVKNTGSVPATVEIFAMT
jgi:hypothetical protein